mgnify:CR=1 FL=1
MAQSIGSRSQIAYVNEVTPGTTPVTPAMKQLFGYQSNTLDLTKGVISDTAIRSNGMKKFSRHGNTAVGGTITASYAPGTQDDLLEAALYGGWSTNLLKLGTTETSMTMEVGYLNTALYRVFTGCHFSGFRLNVPSGNQIVTAEFDVVGMGGSVSGTALDASLTAPTLEGTPLVHLDGVFNLGGAPIAYFTGLQLNVANQLTPNYALGSGTARSVTKGMTSVTGQITAYYESNALATSFLSEATTDISFTLTSDSAEHEYILPNVKLNGFSAPLSGDGPVIATIIFEALYDDTMTSVMSIGRTYP